MILRKSEAHHFWQKKLFRLSQIKLNVHPVINLSFPPSTPNGDNLFNKKVCIQSTVLLYHLCISSAANHAWGVMEDSATEKQPRLKTLRSNGKLGFIQDSKDSQTEKLRRSQDSKPPNIENTIQQMKNRANKWKIDWKLQEEEILFDCQKIWSQLAEDLKPISRRTVCNRT